MSGTSMITDVSSIITRPERHAPGFGPPELTANEIAWVEFLRMICNGRDIGPSLRGVKLLRRMCDTV